MLSVVLLVALSAPSCPPGGFSYSSGFNGGWGGGQFSSQTRFDFDGRRRFFRPAPRIHIHSSFNGRWGNGNGWGGYQRPVPFGNGGGNGHYGNGNGWGRSGGVYGGPTPYSNGWERGFSDGWRGG